MTLVVFDLGTNIDREASLASALEHLSEHFILRKASSIYRTVPVGMSKQPDFFNVSLEVETDKSVGEIRILTREIEDKMGRNRSGPKYGPRNIDIDIVLYGNLVESEMSIPHPQSRSELFVVAPLAELQPEGYHPESKETWRELKLKLMEGRNEKDAGISVQCTVAELPLGPKAKSCFIN